jgi:hypothetical protein
MKFPFLQRLDDIIRVAEENGGWAVTLKTLYSLRAQAFLELEPLMRPVPLPHPAEIDE